MKNYIIISIFVCLFITTTTYGQDRSPADSSSRQGERTSCIQSPGAAKDYVEKEVDRVNNPK